MTVQLRPWSEGDYPLLEKLLGDPEMTRYLGGPETPEQLGGRHQRYLKIAGTGKGQMLVIVKDGESTGSIGFWDTDWKDEAVYETGWSVLPAFQGQGIASHAITEAIELMRTEAKHRSVLAFPAVENAASNAICRKAGFMFLEASDFEYPKGSLMRCNVWRLDLLTDKL